MAQYFVPPLSFAIFFLNKKKYGKNIIRLFMIIVGLSLIETIAGSAERFLSNSETYHPMRLVLSWVCYCVAPGILLAVAETTMRKAAPWKRWLIAVPEIINVLITSSTFFGSWCFTMDASRNRFVSGQHIDEVISWDNWIDQNKAGMDYYVDYIRKDNEIQLKIYNDLLTMEAHLVVKKGHKNKIYFTVSGELCTITKAELYPWALRYRASRY